MRRHEVLHAIERIPKDQEAGRLRSRLHYGGKFFQDVYKLSATLFRKSIGELEQPLSP